MKKFMEAVWEVILKIGAGIALIGVCIVMILYGTFILALFAVCDTAIMIRNIWTEDFGNYEPYSAIKKALFALYDSI